MDTGRRSVSLRLSLCRHRSPHLYKLKATGAASRPLPSAPAFSATSFGSRALSGSMAYVTASIGDVARCSRVQCQNLAKAQRHYHSWLSSAAVL